MAYLNEHYLKLKAGYLFPEIGRRVSAFASAHPEAARRLTRCGIGDVTEPLPAAARAAMHAAIDELGDRATFKGYGPEQGYEFLRHAIAEAVARAGGHVTDITLPTDHPFSDHRIALAGRVVAWLDALPRAAGQ